MRRFLVGAWVVVWGAAVTVAILVVALVCLVIGPVCLVAMAIWLAVSAASYCWEDRRNKRRRNAQF